jgi:hypothetical protein
MDYLFDLSVEYLGNLTMLNPRQLLILAGMTSTALPTSLASWTAYTATDRIPSWCPDYTKYAMEAHTPFSFGPLKLPSMRPQPECRTFSSPAVEVSLVVIDTVDHRSK